MSSANRHLRSINLNLLPILDLLLSTHSVSQTAKRLHMSQSAVSDALARLRAQFNDELLVRSGRGMQPTPFAGQLLPTVRDLMMRVEGMLQMPDVDPARMQREFIIATADPVIMTLGSTLCDRLCELAPQSSIRFVDLHRQDYDRLRDLSLDLVIVPRGFIRAEGLYEAALYEETFVCIARRNHPRIRTGITAELYASLPHAAYRTRENASPGMDTRLLGLEQRDVIMVPNFSLLPFVVERTDAIALIQKRVAERFQDSCDIILHAAPVPLPPLEVCMYWAQGHHQDREHQWLRAQLANLRDPAEGATPH